MPRYRLIDSYLKRLRAALHIEAPGADRILQEIEDHLLTALETDVRGGASPEEAERRAVQRLGEPEAFAAQFQSAIRGDKRLAGRRNRARSRFSSKSIARRLPMAHDDRRSNGEPKLCSFCGLGEFVVGEIVAGPNGVAICPICLARATEIVAKERRSGSPPPVTAAAHPPSSLACSFCGRRHHEVARLVAGPRFVFICDRCTERFSAPVAPG